MKNNLITVLVAVLIICLNQTVQAQKAAAYKIYGTVIDSANNKPADLITVNLRTADKNIKTTLTAADGSFSVEVTEPQPYKLVIVGVGYQTRTIAVAINTASVLHINVGKIALIRQTTQLKDVVVAGNRPTIKQEAGRIIYDLTADPESKGNNLMTMMRKVPFISVDASDNLLLKGNSSFKVFIDGKPSNMIENNLKAILQSMPASTIERIEVITNPPAKYDAEGLAGIINIVTLKKIGDGYKGTLNTNGNYPVGGPGLGSSFSIKQGKVGFSFNGGANYSRSPAVQNLNSRQTFGSNATLLTQTGNRKPESRTGYMGTELSLEINPRNLLTAQLSINGYHFDSDYSQQSLLAGNTGTLESYNLYNNNTGSNNGFDVGLNYQAGFKSDKSKLLTFSYRYTNYGSIRNGQIDIANPVNYNQADYEQDNSTQTAEQTLQIDYVQGIKALVIEAGLKGILRKSESDFQYLLYNAGTSKFEPFSEFSNQFNYHQNVFSAYNSYQYNLKSWSVNAGVRLEKTFIDANFISSGTVISPNYLNVVPSVSFNKTFTDKSSLSVGYNQRIKRPGINRLNPFVDRSNPNYESTGNPALQPVLINNFQLTYNLPKKLAVTMGLSYSFINNIDLRVYITDPATGITRSTYQNMGKASNLNLDFNLSYPLTQRWNLSANGNLAYFNVMGVVDNAEIENKMLTRNVTVSTSYKLDRGWRLNAGAVNIGRNITDLQTKANGLLRTSFSVNKELIRNKLNFATVINNPFTKYRNNEQRTIGANFTQLNITRDYFRSYSVSLNYNFGELKSNIKKNIRGIKNDDVSN
ncbi:TonB-dependent receptor family protein [Mucilaginibacter sp. PAMB04274]|uniref:TonB-dependent receptor family protein n=1 Tax=Mucilaginibacter sp. PAMB04274 TaxID=3138568 RepID=UPI0031F6A215